MRTLWPKPCGAGHGSGHSCKVMESGARGYARIGDPLRMRRKLARLEREITRMERAARRRRAASGAPAPKRLRGREGGGANGGYYR